MRKKVVVHLIPEIPFWGGAEHVLLDIARALDRDRFEMVVLFWGAHDELAAPLLDSGARVERLSFRNVLSWESVSGLVRALKENRADLLHTHFADSDLLGVAAGFFYACPLVSHVHSFPFPQTCAQAWRYRLMAPRIERIVCVSSCVQAYVHAQTGIPADRLPVVPNGIDAAFFAPALSDGRKYALKRALGFEEIISEAAPVIGCVSRFSVDKSMVTFVEAAARILEVYPLARFLVVGDGYERARTEALARSLGLGAHIVFTGIRQDIPEFLAVMDVFALPAVEEAFGISLLEAMASGVPSVAARAAAIPELLRDGREGLLFTPKDPASLARAVLRLLDEPLLARELACAAKKRAGLFTREAMVHGLEQIYTEVLSRG